MKRKTLIVSVKDKSEGFKTENKTIKVRSWSLYSRKSRFPLYTQLLNYFKVFI